MTMRSLTLVLLVTLSAAGCSSAVTACERQASCSGADSEELASCIESARDSDERARDGDCGDENSAFGACFNANSSCNANGIVALDDATACNPEFEALATCALSAFF